LQPSPVKREAERLGLLVTQPRKAGDPEFLATLSALNPDLIVVAAYGQILPQRLLDIPKFGCLNVHTSLLPKYRGAAPIQWAILNDEKETGVTIMRMDAGLDTGDIISQRSTPIDPADNAETLHDRLAGMGARLLVEVIPEYVMGRLLPRKQDAEGSSYARKITKEDGHLAWTMPSRAVWNRVRAFTPWPGAYSFWRPTLDAKPLLLKIWDSQVAEWAAGEPGTILTAEGPDLMIACGAGALRIFSLQREGGRRLSTQEFLNGNQLAVGQRLG
jgi:methionyl-tRNA formyltransferase